MPRTRGYTATSKLWYAFNNSGFELFDFSLDRARRSYRDERLSNPDVKSDALASKFFTMIEKDIEID